MSRKLLFVLAFMLVAAAVGQLSAGAQTYSGTTYPGTFVPVTTIIGPGPATPTATFAAPPPTAGISDAGRAGISNLAPLPPTLPGQSSTVVYVTEPPVETIIPGAPSSVVGNSIAGAPLAAASPANDSGGRTMNDLGPSYYADALSGGTTSLGELSAHYKALKTTVNARVLTNDDIKQMDTKNGVTMAKNMPPLGPGSLEQSGQAQNTGSQPSTPDAQARRQNPPSANPPGQNATNSQAGTPPPDTAKDQSGVSAENSTTPQINQNQQSNDAQGSRRLPATATFLPFLGLLGLLSGGIGFWFRKFRN
ncbi:MAG: hypothetical protein JWM83_2929 [Candidatus Angelobacter sp.]|nr:hypothetical protein [Candidatus Angelobacter sp.]